MRVVTAGSSTRKSRTSRRGEIGIRRPETGGTAGGIGLSLYAAAHQIPHDLQAVEARVAHHRRDGAAAAQVDDAQTAPSRPVASAASHPWSACPAPNAMLVTTRPTT